MRWGESHLSSAETSHELSRCRRWKRSYYGASIASRPGGESTSKPTERSRRPPQAQLTFGKHLRAASPSSLILDDSPRTSKYFVPEPINEVVLYGPGPGYGARGNHAAGEVGYTILTNSCKSRGPKAQALMIATLRLCMRS